MSEELYYCYGDVCHRTLSDAIDEMEINMEDHEMIGERVEVYTREKLDFDRFFRNHRHVTHDLLDDLSAFMFSEMGEDYYDQAVGPNDEKLHERIRAKLSAALAEEFASIENPGKFVEFITITADHIR